MERISCRARTLRETIDGRRISQHRNCGNKMRRPRVFFLALTVFCLMLGKARAQYAYVKHPGALVESRATTAVLPANPPVPSSTA